MSMPGPIRRPSLPAVPVSFLLLLILCAVLYWWLWPRAGGGGPVNPFGTPPVMGPVFQPYQIPGGALHTNGFTKTEELARDTDSWFGTTSTMIRLNATYRYEIPLRSDWKFYVDESRKVAYVLAPPYHPQLPVAVDSRTVTEYTSNGWGRFDKWDQLRQMQLEITPRLKEKARSADYMALARPDARKTVEEFIADWLLKNKGWSPADQPIVKVYFQDDPAITLPPQLKADDFLPR